MKKWVVFLLGFISGIIFFIVASVFISDYLPNNSGETYFEEPGECLSTKSFEIFQVLEDGVALAKEIDKSYSSHNSYTNLLVLLIGHEGEFFYDEQVITIPKGECARQIGVYKYQTKSEVWKTVPIVMIME